eukprot:TRINITY_DN32072_c0_g1_i1.p1 TRINITY_DN32072_c0_g1~~TRINITY_DN32072_c0_g1_i1.p1  ORF type:complete len:957 (+),score=366.46 TRINITY_DN32072_c0_g1_i1:359-2872(+)
MAMHRKLDAQTQRHQEWDAERAEAKAKIARLEETVSRQDQQIQLHLTTRQQIARRMELPPAVSASCQTEPLLDEQNQMIVAAESVATAGLTEARSLRVELQQSKRKITRLEASSARANEACAAYKSGCETLQEEIEHLSKEVSHSRLEHQEDRQKLLAQLRASENRERELHQSIEGLRRRDLSVEDAKREVERLTGQEVEALRAENHALRDEARGLQETSLAIREEFETYHQKYLEILQTLQQVRQQSDEHRRLASDDIQALNRENAEVFDDYNRVREERQEVRAQLTQAEDRIRQLVNEKTERLKIEAEPAAPKPDTVEKAAYDAMAAQLQETAQQLQEAETDASGQKATVQHLQNTNAHLTTQVNMLMEDVQEMRRAREAHRESEAQKVSASATERENLEKLIEKLEVENREIKAERRGEASPDRTTHSPARSPPTRLQALAASEQVQLPTGGVDAGHAAVPPHAHPQPQHPDAAALHLKQQQQESMEGVLAEWAGILNKSLTKAGKLVGAANKFRCYLAAQVPGADGDCPANAVPMIRCTRYAVPAWNKLFEAFSAVKLCLRKAEESGMAMAAQNVVLRRQLARVTSVTPTHDMGAPHAPAGLNVSQHTQQPYEPHPAPPSVGVLPGSRDRLASMYTDIERATSRLGSPEEAVLPAPPQQMPLQHAQPQAPGREALPPMDHQVDTDSESSSNPGEDLHQCTSLIHDTDVLLRASQGADAFWGESRIEYLTRELRALEVGGPTPDRMAQAAAAAAPGDGSMPPLSPVPQDPSVLEKTSGALDVDLHDDDAGAAPIASPGRLVSPPRGTSAPQGQRVMGKGKKMRWGADPAPLYMP